MNPPALATPPLLLSAALPLLSMAAGLLLVPEAAAPPMRRRAATLVLGAMIVAALLALLGLSGHSTPIQLRGMGLCMLGAMLIVAPLADRARRFGLVVAGGLGSLLALAVPATILLHPGGGYTTLRPIHTTLLVATFLGIIGSLLVKPSPLRHTADGAIRRLVDSPGRLFAGWACAMALLLDFAAFMQPASGWIGAVVAMLVAGLVALFAADDERGLQKAGEAAFASLLLSLPAPLSPAVAALIGLIGAGFVLRSEAIAQGLRLDDPLHLIGAVALPGLVGLLVPGVLDARLLAPALTDIFCLLLTTGVAAALLWPITLIFFGLALPQRWRREGPTPS